MGAALLLGGKLGTDTLQLGRQLGAAPSLGGKLGTDTLQLGSQWGVALPLGGKLGADALQLGDQLGVALPLGGKVSADALQLGSQLGAALSLGAQQTAQSDGVLLLGGKIGLDILRRPAHIVRWNCQGDGPGEYEEQDHGKLAKSGPLVSGCRATIS